MPSDARDRNGAHRAQGNVLGSFIRAQRQMANLSLRQLSALAQVSNPYLSQVERGLSEPSVRVLKSIAEALNVSAEAMFEQAGLVDPPKGPDDASEQALRADRRLTESQKRALLTVYRSYLEANGYGDGPARDPQNPPHINGS
ncbi:MAG TPA: helix-turn-helix transcriptional regulator [Aldersonia sp.]